MKKEMDPRMHTAEHILNQTMVRMFDCGRCISAHIERKKSKCDYHFPRPLTETEITEIERRVNAVIEADLPVVAETVSRNRAEERFSLERLPAGVGDAIRIVRVGDYDVCPCIGSHVESTREIGRFRITTAGFQEGVLRIRFKLNAPGTNLSNENRE